MINFYDRYGGKLKGKETAETLTRATSQAKQFLIANAEAVSYTIDRRLHNSLDGES
jgi:hypothetical protein